jgi:hypothetical protein
VRPRSDVPREGKRYGLGFWLHETSDPVMLVGYDAGTSFQSTHNPGSGVTCTVISNTSEGAWPIFELLDWCTRAGRRKDRAPRREERS